MKVIFYYFTYCWAKSMNYNEMREHKSRQKKKARNYKCYCHYKYFNNIKVYWLAMHLIGRFKYK